jgi:hypothetical protein
MTRNGNRAIPRLGKPYYERHHERRTGGSIVRAVDGSGSAFALLVLALSSCACASFRINAAAAGLDVPSNHPAQLPYLVQGGIDVGGPDAPGMIGWSTGAYWRWSRQFAAADQGVGFIGAGLAGRLHLFRLFAGPLTFQPASANCAPAGPGMERCTYTPVGPPVTTKQGMIFTGGLVSDLALGKVVSASRHDFGFGSQEYRIDTEGFGAQFGARGFLRVQYPFAGFLELEPGYENVGGKSIFVARAQMGLAFEIFVKK